MTDFLQNLGTIGCLGAEREAFATQLSATHTTRKSHVLAGTTNYENLRFNVNLITPENTRKTIIFQY